MFDWLKKINERRDNLAPWLSRDPNLSRSGVRLHIVADQLGATQEISFLRPLKSLRDAGICEISLTDEARLNGLRRGAADANIASLIETSWRDCCPDAIVFSRYSGPGAGALQSLARSHGIPILGHLDDDLLGVPEDLGPSKFAFYNDPARLARLRNMLDGCDLVYVSTAELASRLRQHGINAPIAAGTLYCAIDRGEIPISCPASAHSSELRFGYMGTAGHAADLQMIVPAIARTLEQFPSAEFETFGTIQMPAELGRFGARVRHIPRCSDYRSFLLRLAELRWQLGLAPLRDTPFNRCKADTKWVEYTAAGIPVLASRIPVYDKLEEAGALAATSEHGWHDALERLGRDGALRRQLLIQAQKRQQELYSLGHLEEQLRTIFSRIGVALPRT